jgi:hypothetical protein
VAITQRPVCQSLVDIEREVSSGTLVASRVALTEKKQQVRSVYRDLVGRTEGNRPLGRPRRRWEDNIKMDLREIAIGGTNWIQLSQDRVQWRAYVNKVMNFRVP